MTTYRYDGDRELKRAIETAYPQVPRRYVRWIIKRLRSVNRNRGGA